MYGESLLQSEHGHLPLFKHLLPGILALLPAAVDLHAITSINSTVSILSGGFTSTNSFSPLTWYFNHETNIFSAGPSLLEGRKNHDSATCVDKVTKAKIPIVTGGYGNSNVPLDSTEMIINGQWHSGTI